MKTPDENQDEIFKIGAVARLTGLSTHTLRKWESRYGAVAPGRTKRGERYYTRQDLESLSIMKRLVDAGAAPSDVARLSHTDLKRKSEQLAEVESAAGSSRRRPVRAAVVGDAVVALFERQAAAENAVEVVSASTNAEPSSVPEAGPIDVLIYECPIVNGDTRRLVDALRTQMHAAAAVVVYGFSAREDLLTLQSPQLATLRAPGDLRTLEQIVTQLIDTQNLPRMPMHASKSVNDTNGEAPAPRLSRHAIARLARTTPKIRCECPHHLADIVLSLRAFEEYSEACESRSPEDAALHHYLWRSAAQARALFEDAIERVAEVEGITLEE